LKSRWGASGGRKYSVFGGQNHVFCPSFRDLEFIPGYIPFHLKKLLPGRTHVGNASQPVCILHGTIARILLLISMSNPESTLEFS
jgi:hypothetical protein